MRSKSAKNQLSTGCLALFGLPFFAAGLFMSGMYAWTFAQWWSAQRWVEVPCWIDRAELKTSHDDGTTYKTEASYHYVYEGMSYQGDRVSFSSGSDNVGSFQQDAHRELSRHVGRKPAGAERGPEGGSAAPFRCYVNPAKPSEAVLYRHFRWQMQAFLAIFVLTFPAVGAGLVIGGLVGMRTAGKEAALRLRHPDAPWKWKTAWAGDRIPESQGAGRKAVYAYTLWSGMVVGSLVAGAALSGALAAEKSSWWLVIFVALWLIPFSLSLKHLRHRMRVGVTHFEPKEWPWWPGGVAQGQVLLGKPLPIRGDGEAILACRKSISRGSGENRSTSIETVWSESQVVPQDRMIRDLDGFRLPVSFSLPVDVRETSVENTGEETYKWYLDFKVPGTPIRSEFEIPVFRTADTQRMASARAAGAEAATPLAAKAQVDLPGRLKAAKIEAEFDGNGRPVSLRCPPARHLQLILFLVVFDAIWTAAAVFLVKQNAPLIFQIVWPVSAAGIWLAVLWSLLHQRKVTLDDSGLQIDEKLGPLAWKKSFEKTSIIGFTHDSNMTSGNTRYYRVRLESVLGKKQAVVDGITEEATAEALEEQLEGWRKQR